MPECLIFKHGCCIGPTGAVRPCCAFSTKGVPSVYFNEDWQTRHNEWYEQSKNEWLPNCLECKQSEDAGEYSLRHKYNRELQYAEGIKHWDLKINNTCNLACRMCDPTSSSMWKQIADKDPHKLLSSHYHRPITDKWHRQAKDFLPLMIDAEIVKFTGGEPFMIPQVKQIIEGLIELDAAPAINLELITNGTHDITQWNKYFKEFKKVNINISVDAIGKRYEYIRPYSSWDIVNNNILEFNNVKLDNSHIWITALPMILNKNHLHEVEEWCSTNNLPFNKASPCINPRFLRVNAWQDDFLRKEFIEQMDKLDKIHGTDWREFVEEEVTQ